MRDAHPLLGGWSTVRRYDAPTTTNKEDAEEEEEAEDKLNELTTTGENSNVYVIRGSENPS